MVNQSLPVVSSESGTSDSAFSASVSFGFSAVVSSGAFVDVSAGVVYLDGLSHLS